MLASELAKLVGVTTETVRFYTRKGLLKATKQPDNGYNQYDHIALANLKFISHATSIGFTLKEVQEIMDSSTLGNSPCPKVRQMLADKIIETESKIKALHNHLNMMKNTQASWSNKPDTAPDGKAICCLIEEWSDQHTPQSLQEIKHAPK